MTEFGHDNRLALLSGSCTHEHDKVKMAHLDKSLNLTLEILRQRTVLDETFHLELLDGHVRVLELRLVDECCRSLADLLRVLQL